MGKKSSIIEERLKVLKETVDSCIELGYASGSCRTNVRITDYDIKLITPYAKSLGLEPVKQTCNGGVTHWHGAKPNDGLKLVIIKNAVLPKEEETLEEGISISPEDYNQLRFFRKNRICQFLYSIRNKKNDL